MLRFLDAGESHGKALIAIIDGIPSNFIIDVDFVNNELKRRQKGYGRGDRMKIEKDKIEFLSGVRGNKTTGNPITIAIFNKDYENWKEIMSNEPEEENLVKVARPGHGDLVGFFKYDTGDIRNVIERTSARETAIRTAVGAVCRSLLINLDIHIRSKVMNIGGIEDEQVDIFENKIFEKIENSDVRCYNKKVEEKIKKEIDLCKEHGDTVGGSIFVSIKGLPIGIGSYIQWDKKLDANLSRAIMSIQGMKAVEFGNGLDLSKRGSDFNDAIYYENGKIIRQTNNCGGIEAGVSNGENIEFKVYMKPIPTIRKNIHSVDLVNKINVINRYERSDLCGVVPGSVVIENVCAFEILKELMNKFSCDTFDELKESLKKYRLKF